MLKIKKKIYKRMFIIFLIIIIILFVFVIKISIKDNDKKHFNKIEFAINYFNNNVFPNKEEFNHFFKNRYILINNDELSIGKNKNELENGYYDIRLKIKKETIELYINKLFKEYDKDIVCDDTYVSEIIDYIIKIFNLDLNKDEFTKLIISNYRNLRIIDRNNVDNVEKSIIISDINLTLSIQNNILLIKMGDIW